MSEQVKSFEEFVELQENILIINSCSPKHFKLLGTFHPSGKSVPNSSHIHKGFYYEESEKNKNAFIINEKIHDEQYGLRKYKGGVIVFSVDVNAEKLSDNKILNKIRQFWETFKQRYNKNSKINKIIRLFNDDKTKLVNEKIYSCSVGNYFKGKYLSDDNHLFNEKSTTIEVNGITSSSLLLLAEYICKIFKQETVLVKDFNANKIYLADKEKFDGSIEDLDKQLSQVNIESK